MSHVSIQGDHEQSAMLRVIDWPILEESNLDLQRAYTLLLVGAEVGGSSCNLVTKPALRIVVRKR